MTETLEQRVTRLEAQQRRIIDTLKTAAGQLRTAGKAMPGESVKQQVQRLQDVLKATAGQLAKVEAGHD